MPDIRYVCVSDLHFGAENSVLTCLAPNSLEPDPHRPSTVMTALIDCLHDLVGHNEGDQKPALVLCGDILELALSTDNLAAMVFDRFIELAFPRDGSMFDDTVYFVPGNHDHHLWEGARERQYADFVRSQPLGEYLPPPWHTTRMFTERDQQPVESELLNALVRRHPGLAHVTVRAVYPNLAVSRDGRTRCVVFHHGHFVEGLYRLMSQIKDMVFAGRPTRVNVWDWEAENFAWIDFFWSTLGRSGQVGTDVGLVYASLQSDRAMQRLARNLAQGISARLRGPVAVRWVEGRLLDFFLGRAVQRVGRLERIQPRDPLSPRARAGLQLYLEGPLRNQLLAEVDGHVPHDVTFIFGHTHKPFETRLSPAGYPGPVRVFNTGGWVVDTLTPVPVQGASAILLDEDLNAVALRFYNQTPDGSPMPVRLAKGEPDDGRPNPLYDRLDTLVDPGKEPWKTFSTAAASLVRERYADMAKTVEQVARSMEGQGQDATPSR